MGAPKGNEFWKLRSKHGRDKLFSSKELLWNAVCEYFEWCDANPLLESKLFHYQGAIVEGIAPKMRAYTMVGLCLYLDCSENYFNNFEDNNKDSKDFMEVIVRIRETVYNQKFVGAAADMLNPNIIARDLGLADKSENNTVIKEELIWDKATKEEHAELKVEWEAKNKADIIEEYKKSQKK